MKPSYAACRLVPRQLLLMLLSWLSAAVGPLSAQTALPGRIAWQYELRVGPQPARPEFQDFYQLAQLSPTRFLAVGWDAGHANDERPLLMFIAPNGDTSCRRLPELHPLLRLFHRVVPNPDKSFVTFSAGSTDSLGRYGVLLWHFDSLGNPGWNRAIEFRDAQGPMTGFLDNYPIRLPDGYLLAADYMSNATGNPTFGCVIKTDLRGSPKWHVWGDVYEWFRGYAQTPIGICPDGSYVVVSTSVAHLPPPVNVWDRDWHLWRVLPSGDTLRPTYFGARRTLERAFGLAATPDNGVLVSGDRTPYAPQPQRRPVAYAVKFDSLFRMQWQVRRPPNHPPGGAAFLRIYPLANGHYLATGYTAVLDAGSTTAYHYEGLHAEIAAPASPTDTVGVIVGEWLIPMGSTQQILPQPGDSTAYIFGQGQQNLDGRTYFGKLTGLVPPLDMALCARPPLFTQPPSHGPLAGSSLTFALDSAATRPGPRYGEISLVTWDFGDNSPMAEGWTVSHGFASPQPVRVQVCATNNLNCRTCADLYPFGPVAGVGVPKAAPAPTVSVYPNPSASGVFTITTVGAPPTGTYAVLDATGRRVAAGALSGPETALDLRGQAAGVYALRLTWADGRTLTRRLVRW